MRPRVQQNARPHFDFVVETALGTEIPERRMSGRHIAFPAVGLDEIHTAIRFSEAVLEGNLGRSLDLLKAKRNSEESVVIPPRSVDRQTVRLSTEPLNFQPAVVAHVRKLVDGMHLAGVATLAWKRCHATILRPGKFLPPD